MVFIFMILWTSVSMLVMGTMTNGQAVGNGNSMTFVSSFCSPTSGDALGFFVLETIWPSIWPRDKFCLALADGAADTGNYNITLQLFNAIGLRSDNVTIGHSGIAFNAKDSMNYDFIYFRLYLSDICYQIGYTKENVLYLGDTSTCPHGPPKGQTWFTVLLEIIDQKTKVFLDGDHVVTFSHHHDNIERGGAIVSNGYMNHVFFRGYNTERLWIDGYQTRVADCVSHTRAPAYRTLDATSGTWAASGFCRVLIGSSPVYGTEYHVTVDLYNAQGWRGISSGNLGVMFNAKDINNFDFVYFRPHSRAQCFQTGYVLNREMMWDSAVSGTCGNKVTFGDRWFNIEVHVKGEVAAIYKDGVLIFRLRTKFEPRGHGGVIVANGYKNIVRYKSYSVRAVW